MKKVSFLFFFILLIGLNGCFAQQNVVQEAGGVHIVPEPVSLQKENGHFQLNNTTRVIFLNDQTSDIAKMLAGMLKAPTGFQLNPEKEKSDQAENAIMLKLNKTADAQLGDEGYTLNVSPDEVVIAANKPHGLF